MAISKKIYIILLAFVIIASFLIIFFVYPVYTEIQGASKELISEKKSSISMAGEIEELENFGEKYEIYKPGLERIDNLFLDYRNPVEFIKFLENLSSELGIELNISTPSFLQKKNLALDSFRLSSIGDFSKILLFTRALETGPYLIEIQDLAIKKYTLMKAPENQSEPEIVEASFLINVYAK